MYQSLFRRSLLLMLTIIGMTWGGLAYCDQQAAQITTSRSAVGQMAISKDYLQALRNGVMPLVRAPINGSTFVKKITELLALHGGFIEPKELELAFNATVTPRADLGNGNYSADLKANSKWFDNVSYGYYAKPDAGIDPSKGANERVSVLNIYWGKFSFGDDYCISPIEMVANLKSQGWRISIKKIESGDLGTNNFITLENPINGSRATVTYSLNTDQLGHSTISNACILGFLIQGIER
jgi:hypothetical protein